MHHNCCPLYDLSHSVFLQVMLSRSLSLPPLCLSGFSLSCTFSFSPSQFSLIYHVLSLMLSLSFSLCLSLHHVLSLFLWFLTHALSFSPSHILSSIVFSLACSLPFIFSVFLFTMFSLSFSGFSLMHFLFLSL